MDITQLVRKNILDMAPYSSARDECKVSAKIFLDANESPFDNGVNRYPDPHQIKLKECIGKVKQVAPENIILGNGSDEIIDLAFRAFCEPGEDNVIVTPPTYGMYQVIANLNNVSCKKVNLNPDFSLNTAGILAAMDDHTKIIFLCSPNNPSGNLLQVEAIEDILKETRGLVFLDEAYIDFSGQGSWIKRLAAFPNLFIGQTLSKAWGMAGIRLGIGLADPKIIEILSKIKPPYNVSRLTQDKAMELLQDQAGYEQRLDYLIAEKSRLKNALQDLSCVEKIFPSDANFWLVRFRDAGWVYDRLAEKGIILRNRSSQPLCDNCLRITVGLKAENDALIDTLKNL